MFHVGIAYLLWLFGGFGALGLHRFYLRKIPTGVLWLCTGGMFFLGALYDFFTLGRQVADLNLREAALATPASVTVKREKEPLERAILRLAQANAGRVTAVQVAAASDWSIEQAQKHLDTMARQRVCEIRVAKSGTVVYHFAEFDPTADQSYEV
jgi:hypothetical protein